MAHTNIFKNIDTLEELESAADSAYTKCEADFTTKKERKFHAKSITADYVTRHAQLRVASFKR